MNSDMQKWHKSAGIKAEACLNKMKSDCCSIEEFCLASRLVTKWLSEVLLEIDSSRDVYREACLYVNEIYREDKEHEYETD